MEAIAKLTAIPKNSAIASGFGEVHYHDTYQIQKKTEEGAEEISRMVMQLPNWALVLLKLRNSIVKIFGLKTDSASSETFFTLIEKNDSEVVMGELDKHLDFRLSIMKDTSANTVSLTTIVHFNNTWGRIYFFPVKPFHKIIVKALLKKYLKT